MAAGRFRRARSLVVYWEDGEFVVENYLSHRRTTISPAVAQLLHQLDDYRPREEILARFRSVPNVEGLFEALVEQTILLEEGSDLDEKDVLLDETWAWGHDAKHFHYATQSIDYEPDLDRQREQLVALAEETPPPSPYKDCGRVAVELEPSFDDRTGGLWDVLGRRRTKREFERDPISFAEFSTLVQWTWGKTAHVRNPDVGDHLLKTSPSGGARHPIEVYPVVLRVEDVPSGLYHYSVRHHALERLDGPVDGMLEDLCVTLCGHHDWVRDAAAVFFMTAVIERSMWKYDHSRAYRVVQLDAGHLGQTFHLVATALELAPFTTAAMADQRIEELLGLDGVAEFPVYAAAVGVPEADDG